MNIELIAGLFVGILFGFLLHKAKLTRFSMIVGQLMLKNFTVVKVIMTAIAAGSIGLYSLKCIFQDAELLISPTTLLAAALGGGIFGIGMAVLGYCPGTCVGALADKSKDAWFGFLGMICGAGIYAESFSWIKLNLKPDTQINVSTLPEYFAVSPWVFISLISLAVAFLAASTSFRDLGMTLRIIRKRP